MIYLYCLYFSSSEDEEGSTYAKLQNPSENVYSDTFGGGAAAAAVTGEKGIFVLKVFMSFHNKLTYNSLLKYV